jgi:hypothetical protein
LICANPNFGPRAPKNSPKWQKTGSTALVRRNGWFSLVLGWHKPKDIPSNLFEPILRFGPTPILAYRRPKMAQNGQKPVQLLWLAKMVGSAWFMVGYCLIEQILGITIILAHFWAPLGQNWVCPKSQNWVK